MASDTLGILRAELETLINEVAEIEREHQDKQFPDDVAERWNRANRTIEDYKKRIELAQRGERMEELNRMAKNEASTERIGDGVQIRDSRWREDPFDLTTVERSLDPAKEARQYRDRAKIVIERELSFRRSNVGSDDAKEHLDNLIEDVDPIDGGLSRHMVVNGSPLYKEALGKYLSGGMLNSEQGRALELSRALSLSTTAGGYAVPTELDPTIIPTSNYTVNPFRAISRVIPVAVDNWNGVSSGAVTAAYQAEATPTTDSSPTLAQVAISTERATAFIPFSIEIGQDWGALQSEMGQLLGDAKDVLEATKFTLGSGTNEPYGVITGATALYTAASTSSLAVTDLYGMELALAARFRANATMLFTRAVAQKLRGFDTGSGAGSGSNVWIDNLRQGVSNNAVGQVRSGYNANVLGYPAYESVDMSSTFTTGQKLICFGDFSQYIIIDRVGMNIEVIPHLFDVTNNQPTGQRGLFAYWRNGAKVASASAFVVLKLA